MRSLDAFPRNRSRRDGRGTYCKPCHREYTGQAAQRLYGSQRNFMLRLRYGITEDQVEMLRALQSGRCAICGEARKLQVDHDHRSGLVRGLLCFNCNVGLGQADDDIELLQDLVAYLDGEAHETVS